jgi:CRP-like cAMP-binding protein
MLKPGDHFINLGHRTQELAFVNQGVLRVYISSADLQEATTHFLRRDQFAMDIPSFYDDLPATVSVQAVTEVALLVINLSTWYQLIENVPKMFVFAKIFS